MAQFVEPPARCLIPLCLAALNTGIPFMGPLPVTLRLCGAQLTPACLADITRFAHHQVKRLPTCIGLLRILGYCPGHAARAIQTRVFA
eukprot:334998-Chlamydomonas_euryale.AAC.12